MSEQDVNLDVKSLFHKRFNEARAAMYTADWTPDKSYSVQRTIVPYVSINKMKRTISPILLKYGIDFKVNFQNLNLVSHPSGQASYWTVECCITFYDVETGYGEESCAYGGCGASDKGVTIAQSYAMKQVLSNQFLVIDGIEPEDIESKAYGTFHSKTEEEVEEVKSEILSNSKTVKKDPVKKNTVKTEVKGIPEEDIAPKVEEALKDVPKDTPKTETGFELAGPQKNTIEKIKADWEAAAKNGQTTPENYNSMSYDCASIASTKDAVAFIRKYRAVF